MLTVTMVGAQFRPPEAKALTKAIDIGQLVELRADPDNEYDSTAVAVYYEDTHIGFIPKAMNGELFTRLQEGEEITAEVVAFESSLKPILEIE